MTLPCLPWRHDWRRSEIQPAWCIECDSPTSVPNRFNPTHGGHMVRRFIRTECTRCGRLRR